MALDSNGLELNPAGDAVTGYLGQTHEARRQRLVVTAGPYGKM